MQTTPPPEPVMQANLVTHVKELTAKGPRHRTNPTAVTATLTYLKTCLSGYGYNVHDEPYGKDPHEVNRWCELTGTGKGPVLEIGAHWDTVELSPGADDNASGVAGLLEIARVLRTDQANGRVLTRTVRFCLFGGEEDQPNLCTGSRHHVSTFTTSTMPDGAIVLEMIGYRDANPNSQQIPGELLKLNPLLKAKTTGDFIAAIGIDNAKGYLTELETGASTHKVPMVRVDLPSTHPVTSAPMNYTGTNVARSDHAPYWDAGIKGVMVTDTANFRNPHYHKSGDVLSSLDFGFAERVTNAVADAVRVLAA